MRNEEGRIMDTIKKAKQRVERREKKRTPTMRMTGKGMKRKLSR